ncbi:MAG: lysophospholipid acyltransferase family protein [Prochloraceae cyanobacterium]|nr:lysophospholipid acyltransferase family protein [Prochloraceae cyanobacterium]
MGDTPKQFQQTPLAPQRDFTTSRVVSWLACILYPLGRYLVLPFYFGQIEVLGQQNLPTEGAIILAPTHRSRWDALLVPYATGRDVTGRDLQFMVSASEMMGVQGWFIRRLGGFPVNTEHPGISSLRHGIELLCKQLVLVIFPEGNIYRSKQVQPLEPGLARLALQAESHQRDLNIKIIPLAISYSQSIPHWGCDVEIQIGEPMLVAPYCKEPLKLGAFQLTTDLKKALQKLCEHSKYF